MQRLEDWQVQRARDLVASEAEREGAALPMLHAVQAMFGYVPDETIPMMADAMNISRAEMFAASSASTMISGVSRPGSAWCGCAGPKRARPWAAMP